MSEKTDSKKEQIRRAARRVFAEKGFKNVTMKDIVDACGISRGGLYLYYSSTEEILLDVLRRDTSSGGIFEEAFGRKKSAGEILRLFLEEQKKELLSPSGNLAAATYEYGFFRHSSQEMRSTFTDAVQAVEYLIHIGRRRHEFSCPDPHAMAVNIMFAIEGMKVSSGCFDLSEEEINREIDFLLEQLRAKIPHRKADEQI